jgi:hypothetical protein
MMKWKVTIKSSEEVLADGVEGETFCIFVEALLMSTAIRIATHCIVDAGAGEIVEVEECTMEDVEAYHA